MQHSYTKEELKQTGVYQIKNTTNDKIYIGSAAVNFKCRLVNHISTLKNNKHRNIHLQRAWNLYTENNFVFSILDVCPPEECLKREQYYMDLLNPKYNICKFTTNGLGVKKSEETKQKISSSLLGKTVSPETRVKYSLAKKGEKHSLAKLTQEQVNQMRAIYNKEDISQDALGKLYNIGQAQVQSILTNIAWYDPTFIPTKKQRGRKTNYETVY